MGEFFSLDLILLGMGGDGYIVFLFFYIDVLKVSDCLIVVGNKDG